ncbi:fas apoptotic inhibitory molecule 1-like [Takifugu rubripes]|uniref:Fas apoptotic inhibitory molecule b n=1 Tax=Takifugu rubripes TaxID=31033 RepID=H2TM75_TAKRU|nr:fas apoptotic inhibitory molecule 1-like [Takifugu rubripes]
MHLLLSRHPAHCCCCLEKLLLVLVMLSGDLVAAWDLDLSDGVHRIQFSHGTTTGKRLVCVNGQEVIRKDWMFKLVGKETFVVGSSKTKATIKIEAVGGFAYEYSLEVDGKSLQRFTHDRAQTTSTWLLNVDGQDCRVVLEKDTMDVWCNGQKMETTGEFVEDGTETLFSLGEHECCIKAMSTGKKKKAIVHLLLLDGEKVPASTQ